MNAYKNFAYVYDLFMKDIPYDEWVLYIHKLWEHFGCKPTMVAELGCGTGSVTARLSQQGIDMIGIDLSEDMLLIAKEKAQKQNLDILYLQQDMREFELYGTVDSIISICDSMNYLLEEEELLQTFKWVNNYLNPKGLFIFDMNTEYKFKCILQNNTFVEHLENASYIWENEYEEEDGINGYYMNFFIKDEGSKLYERYEETHYERAYSLEKVKTLLEEAGMKVLAVYDAYTFSDPHPCSERVFFVAQEIVKNT